LGNYQLPDKLRDARTASVEIVMLLRSIRDAVDQAETNALCPYGTLKNPDVQQREATKIRLLAERMRVLVSETAWPTPNDFLRLEPEIVAMLMELSEGEGV
jgi:hypothetical protein